MFRRSSPPRVLQRDGRIRHCSSDPRPCIQQQECGHRLVCKRSPGRIFSWLFEGRMNRHFCQRDSAPKIRTDTPPRRHRAHVYRRNLRGFRCRSGGVWRRAPPLGGAAAAHEPRPAGSYSLRCSTKRAGLRRTKPSTMMSASLDSICTACFPGHEKKCLKWNIPEREYFKCATIKATEVYRTVRNDCFLS